MVVVALGEPGTPVTCWAETGTMCDAVMTTNATRPDKNRILMLFAPYEVRAYTRSSRGQLTTVAVFPFKNLTAATTIFHRECSAVRNGYATSRTRCCCVRMK